MRITENKCNCSHQMMPITDYSDVSTLYQPTWEDSGVFTIVYRINPDGSTAIVDLDLNLHVVDCKPQREVYDLPKLIDGWYKVRSYILPTREFLESLGMKDGYNDMEYQLYWLKENPDNIFRKEHVMTLALDKEGICFQGRMPKRSPYTSGAFYYWLRADIIDVIDEFQARGVQNGYVYGTNVRVIEEDFFTTCNLYRCFVYKAQDLLNSYKGCSTGSGICNNSKYSIKCKSDVDECKIQVRDYLWMVLNAIKYAIECEDYQSANSLLDCVTTCNGVCSDVPDYDCGCGQFKPMTSTKMAVIPVEAYGNPTIFNFDNYLNKSQILTLLNNKQDKLTAGIDINITDDNVINNQHRFLSDADIKDLWNE